MGEIDENNYCVVSIFCKKTKQSEIESKKLKRQDGSGIECISVKGNQKSKDIVVIFVYT